MDGFDFPRFFFENASLVAFGLNVTTKFTSKGTKVIKIRPRRSQNNLQIEFAP